jgi:hypothetical protein
VQEELHPPTSAAEVTEAFGTEPFGLDHLPSMQRHPRKATRRRLTAVPRARTYPSR